MFAMHEQSVKLGKKKKKRWPLTLWGHFDYWKWLKAQQHFHILKPNLRNVHMSHFWGCISNLMTFWPLEVAIFRLTVYYQKYSYGHNGQWSQILSSPHNNQHIGSSDHSKQNLVFSNSKVFSQSNLTVKPPNRKWGHITGTLWRINFKHGTVHALVPSFDPLGGAVGC